MSNPHPPTHEESLAYIETLRETRDPLPARRGSGLLLWILIFALFAFFSGAVFSASAQGSPRARCTASLAALANPRLMSRATATRKARRICEGLEYGAPNYFRAITQ